MQNINSYFYRGSQYLFLKLFADTKIFPNRLGFGFPLGAWHHNLITIEELFHLIISFGLADFNSLLLSNPNEVLNQVSDCIAQLRHALQSLSSDRLV